MVGTVITATLAARTVPENGASAFVDDMTGSWFVVRGHQLPRQF
jgi:hypothetical protein